MDSWNEYFVVNQHLKWISIFVNNHSLKIENTSDSFIFQVIQV